MEQPPAKMRKVSPLLPSGRLRKSKGSGVVRVSAFFSFILRKFSLMSLRSTPLPEVPSSYEEECARQPRVVLLSLYVFNGTVRSTFPQKVTFQATRCHIDVACLRIESRGAMAHHRVVVQGCPSPSPRWAGREGGRGGRRVTPAAKNAVAAASRHAGGSAARTARHRGDRASASTTAASASAEGSAPYGAVTWRDLVDGEGEGRPLRSLLVGPGASHIVEALSLEDAVVIDTVSESI